VIASLPAVATAAPPETTLPDREGLSVKGLCHSYGKVPVLEAISLRLAAGEFLSLLGPSGCGKTTLLRLIAGLEPLTTGSVRIDGQEVSQLPAERRGVGMVFQSYALFPNLDVRGNVGYGLRRRRIPRAQAARETEALLERVGLSDFGGRFPSELSGGQQQRVALARALAIAPRLLLLDEPFSALDAKVREETRLWVRSLQRETGVTTVLVTHDQEEAMAVSDRIALLEGGRLVQTGTPDELYRHPATLFVAGFLGTANRFPGIFLPRLDAALEANKDLEAVVRPEDLQLMSPESDGIPVRLCDESFLGPFRRLVVRDTQERMYLCLQASGKPLPVRLGAFASLTARPGSVLRFRDTHLVTA